MNDRPEATLPKHKSRSTGDSEQRGAIDAPHTVNDIPGLGPIRARALVKAGLGDVTVLRLASLEQLAAVPGMSEIKARHIQDYLAQFTPETLAAAKSAALPDPGPVSLAASTNLALTLNVDGPTVRIASPQQLDPSVVQEGERVLSLTLALLMTEPALGYRARLLREAIGFMQLVMALLRYPLPEAKARERATRRLQSVAAALSDALAGPELDRKAQTRLADELAQAGDRLEALIGSTPRRRSAETADE